MSTDAAMSDAPSSAAAATSTSAAAAVPMSLHHSLLPSGHPLHCAYLRGLSKAQFSELQKHAGKLVLREGKVVERPHFALIRSELIVDLFQLECAAVKSSLQQLRNKLKTRDLHQELLFNLGHTGHINTAVRTLAADDKCAGVVVALLHGTEEKLSALQTALAPLSSLVQPLPSLRSHCALDKLTKLFKIQPSELQLAFPHFSATATPANDANAAAAAAAAVSIAPPAALGAPPAAGVDVRQFPAQDPLLLAVIGRISTKI